MSSKLPLLSTALLGALLLIGGIVMMLRIKLPARATKPAFKPAYLAREPMTQTERQFFLRLVQAVPQAVVAPQVAMSALVDLPSHQNQGKYKHANRAKFAQQRLDFVLFDAGTGEAVCVVELDDHTHDSRSNKSRDAERDVILEGVGYTVARFDARKMPSVAELRAFFEA